MKTKPDEIDEIVLELEQKAKEQEAKEREEDELYKLTEALFGSHSYFEIDWGKGWRPVLDDNEDGTKDILWQSPLGSYSRLRDSEIDRFGSAARYCFDKMKEKLKT